MCRNCDAAKLPELVTRAEALLAEIPATYRRGLTPIELAYGDVPRVRQDYDDAAVTIASIAGPIVRKMATQLVKEAVALAKAKDVAGISRVAPSYVGELATALKKGIGEALKTGRSQVMDQYAAQKGTRFEILVPRRKQVKKVSEYLSARADIDAERISAAITASVQSATIGQIARASTLDWLEKALNYENPDSILARAILGGENSLIGTATADAREGIGLGRLFALDEVKEDVDFLTYTAILDDNVCSVCADLDGQEFDANAIDMTPNDDCVGAQYGNECRCYMVVVFKRD